MRLGLGIGINTLPSRGGGGPSFAPDALMSTLGEGAAQLIAHPLEYGSMFIDRAGTTPVTESGQLVGRVLDAGGGNYHAAAISDASRGIFRDVGGFRWLEYNGINTSYQTPVLPAPGADKMQSFIGAKKRLGGRGMLFELSPNAGVNDGGAYLIDQITVGGGDCRFTSRGTIEVAAVAPPVTYPITRVLTGIGDISGDSAVLRINGVQVAQSTADQGTGNYNPEGNRRIYYGFRSNNSLFFDGRHYATLSPIVRFGTNATEAQIEAAEAYYTARTDL